jgi:catechol 2,3-dioxygenase-like lactoylglutathione lyase family enzyme
LDGSAFAVQSLDHINVLVPDRQAAARWYQRVFGLQPLRGEVFEMAANMPDGPLFLGIDNDVARVKVALLTGEPLGQHDPVGVTRVAFGVDGPAFLAFLARLNDLALVAETGEPVTRAHVVDQWIGWSLFFCDPFGNRYELVTYEYELVKARLSSD